MARTGGRLRKLGRLTGMAYDQDLADRIRRLIGSDPDLTEKKMFGGLAFLIAGNMAIAASGQGGVMVRVDPQQSDALVTTTTASLAEMRGRPMTGWLRVSSDDLRTDDQLALWVEKGTEYARQLRRPRPPGSADGSSAARLDLSQQPVGVELRELQHPVPFREVRG